MKYYMLTIIVPLVFAGAWLFGVDHSENRSLATTVSIVQSDNAVEPMNSISEEDFAIQRSGDVKIYTVKRGSSYFGHSIWLSRIRGHVKAKYFAYKEMNKPIYQRYTEWKNGRNIIFYCSGPYTTKDDYSLPLGLTIDNGNLVNNIVDMKMDGLVVVEAVGGVRIANLDDNPCCINIVRFNKCVCPRNPPDFPIFIDWAKLEYATVFQTNLLYFKNSAKFTDVPDVAERRLLIIAIDNANPDNIVHILFDTDVDNRISLTTFAREVFRYLYDEKNLNVIGIINLDTGQKNIFQTYYESGAEITNIKGPVSINIASNLLVYYYD
jgi:hypothetical protein